MGKIDPTPIPPGGIWLMGELLKGENVAFARFLAFFYKLDSVKIIGKQILERYFTRI